MKILITGRKGKLYETVMRSFPSSRGFQVVTIPVGSKLLEMMRTMSFDALILTLSSKEEIQPVRWILRQNLLLPLLAVLGREDRKLREQLLDEGVSEVVQIRGLSPAQIRRKLRVSLLAAGWGLVGLRRFHRKLMADLHALRSPLTAILGNAELAANSFSPSHPIRQELQEIIRAVAEIEKTLRRIERSLKIPGLSSE